MSDPVTLPAPELGATRAKYDAWLHAHAGADEEYLRTTTRVRFEPRDADVVIAMPDLVVHATTFGSELRGAAMPSAIALTGVPKDKVVRFLGQLDGERTLEEACRSAALEGDARRALLVATFGRVLFAPHAVTALERAISGVEVVRFPGAPYEIERPYWENMAAVRARFGELEACLGEPTAALAELGRQHVVALLGESGSSFYRPASRVARHGVTPGELWPTPSRTEETPAGTRFVEGPRVHVPLLGGPGYGALLAELSGDPEATLARREHTDEGVSWGRVVTARADSDPQPEPWFCPPRPITREHVALLFGALGYAVEAAALGRRDTALRHLADFHQRFVRLHPFRACNQALAMNLVNAVLLRVKGAGMPHLVLDHVALRWAPAAYRRLFALAADAWCVTGAPAARLGALLAQKADYYALVAELTATTDAAGARIIAETSPDAARLALLSFE